MLAEIQGLGLMRGSEDATLAAEYRLSTCSSMKKSSYAVTNNDGTAMDDGNIQSLQPVKFKRRDLDQEA